MRRRSAAVLSPEPFVSRAKAPPAKRSEKGYGDENGSRSANVLTINPPASSFGELSALCKRTKNASNTLHSRENIYGDRSFLVAKVRVLRCKRTVGQGVQGGNHGSTVY